MDNDIKYIIDATLEQMNMSNEDASDLIFATGKAESGYRALRQYGGPALGYFQMEPATCRDIWENYVMYRAKFRDKLYTLGFDDSKLDYCLLSNIGLQVAFCRLHYRRVPDALPKARDVASQAKYWKTHYNTVKGKGTTEHFVEANNG